jgi:hypothetical protein
LALPTTAIRGRLAIFCHLLSFSVGDRTPSLLSGAMDVNADTVQFAEDLQGFYLSKNT